MGGGWGARPPEKVEDGAPGPQQQDESPNPVRRPEAVHPGPAEPRALKGDVAAEGEEVLVTCPRVHQLEAVILTAHKSW